MPAGYFTSASRGTGLRTQPAPALTFAGVLSDSRRHRTLLHQLVATGWRPLVEQGCEDYRLQVPDEDNFLLIPAARSGVRIARLLAQD